MKRAAGPRKVAVVGLAALALGGCGGSSSPATVSPKTYVKSICTALASWSAGIKSAGTQLQAAATTTNSLAKGKQEYQGFVATLVSATTRTARDMKRAGVPGVTNGKRISDALVGSFNQAITGLTQAETLAGAIPTTNASAYQAAQAGVSASIRGTLGRMVTAPPQKDPQLHAAAAKEPACVALKSA